MKSRFARYTKGWTVLNKFVRKGATTAAGCWMLALLACALLLIGTPLRAQAPALPSVTVGAGVQTSFVHDAPKGGESSDTFPLNSVRLYVGGSAAKNVKFMFNTEYDGPGNHVTILDAAAQF